MLHFYPFVKSAYYGFAFFIVFFTFCVGIAEDQNAKPQEFIRVRYAENPPNRIVALDTAVVHFESKSQKKNAPTVDLIAAIHIADKEYYEELNKLFGTYDVVLYELVAEEGTRIDPKIEAKSDNKSLTGSVQNGFASVLKLEHQLHHIDYTKPNMLHADMDAELFMQRMIQEGELGKIFVRAMAQSIKQSGSESDKTAGRIFGAWLASRDKSIALKRIMAVEICKEIEEHLWIFEGDDGATLIQERNAYALKKLRNVLEVGNKKKIAIFYGGGHLYNFSEQLEKKFNMRPVQTDWIRAWNMGDKK
ncbi:MAG: hypothetical protein LBJ67_18120 [Planctomycetaceae bacterium]|jgi:hypothetical protein|nr:hypothetical protein [Planctomycetaceae bacterium]